MCTRIKFKYAFRWVSSRLIKDHRDAPAEGQNYPRAASHAASRGREHSGYVGKPYITKLPDWRETLCYDTSGLL